jgi:7-cyano-7-deazaguanine reductase
MTGVLGSRVDAPKQYSPEILEAIPRAPSRERLGISNALGYGFDAWHCYELSWLREGGVPVSRYGVLVIPADSPATVESKSLKLYLNSLNFYEFLDDAAAQDVIEQDVSAICGAPVSLALEMPWSLGAWTREAEGYCIDNLQMQKGEAHPSVDEHAAEVNETLHSHLLRSLCPVTGQPDWATLEVEYRGRAINRASLLQYVLSFREHQDFHEQCVEQIYAEIQRRCEPDRLTVRAYYQRRGGIDITPHRSSKSLPISLDRLARQ